MSELMQAIALLKHVFDKYAGKQGDSRTLTKYELAELCHSEVPGTGPTNEDEVERFFKMLDEDRNGVVTFKEYVTFVTALTLMCTQK